MDEANNFVAAAAAAAAAGLFNVIGDRGKTAAVVYCKSADSVQCIVLSLYCLLYSVHCTV